MSDPNKTLDELAREIETQALKGDEDLLATALLVREIKHRIQAGEAGPGVKWTQWGQDKFGFKKSWLYELNAIASAKDPKAALACYRRKNAEYYKRYIERNECDAELVELIRRVRQLDIEDRRDVRKYICHLTGA